jgi:hypothetical protein
MPATNTKIKTTTLFGLIATDQYIRHVLLILLFYDVEFLAMVKILTNFATER